MIITTQKLFDSAKLPQKNIDGITTTLFACLIGDDDGFIDIEPHSSCRITTGLSMTIPAGYVAIIYPDSALADEQGLDIAGGIAIRSAIDSGEMSVMLHNESDYTRTIVNGQAIARMLIMPAVAVDFA